MQREKHRDCSWWYYAPNQILFLHASHARLTQQAIFQFVAGPKIFQHVAYHFDRGVLLFTGSNPAGIGDSQVGHCIFKNKQIASKVTINGLR